jgi:hypothetical protein
MEFVVDLILWAQLSHAGFFVSIILLFKNLKQETVM